MSRVLYMRYFSNILKQIIYDRRTNTGLQFEKILKRNRQVLMDDPFMREHISSLLVNIRTEVLVKLIKPKLLAQRPKSDSRHLVS